MAIKAKPVNSGLLYQNKQHFALVDPTGSAVQLGSENRCIAEYYARRFPKRLVLSDDEFEHAKTLLTAAGWQVIPVTMGIFTRDVDLRKLLKAG